MTSRKITPFLWFDGDALDAAELYVKVHPRSKILNVARRGDTVMSVTFELDGQRVMALNGGPVYRLTPAFSFYVDCADQAEVDRLWAALLAGGGKEVRCGWLVDRFGVSWQIIPEALPRLIGDPDPEKARRVVEAMMGMQKLDVAALERAHAGT